MAAPTLESCAWWLTPAPLSRCLNPAALLLKRPGSPSKGHHVVILQHPEGADVGMRGRAGRQQVGKASGWQRTPPAAPPAVSARRCHLQPRTTPACALCRMHGPDMQPRRPILPTQKPQHPPRASRLQPAVVHVSAVHCIEISQQQVAGVHAQHGVLPRHLAAERGGGRRAGRGERAAAVRHAVGRTRRSLVWLVSRSSTRMYTASSNSPSICDGGEPALTMLTSFSASCADGSAPLFRRSADTTLSSVRPSVTRSPPPAANAWPSSTLVAGLGCTADSIAGGLQAAAAGRR